MVVHTPSKLDILRQTAAERRAAEDGVPPSVAAAAAAAGISVGDERNPAVASGLDAAADAAAVAAADADRFLGAVGGADPVVPAARAADDPLAHEFDAWNGDLPPGILPPQLDGQPEVKDGKVNANVTTRKGKSSPTGTQADSGGARAKDSSQQDNVSVVSDVTPPPNHGGFPQLNPFTPEWFQQMIGAAVSAAATAVANSARPAPSTSPSSAPRRLNDRKVPDFWEDKPEFWFRIFDAHLAHFNPTERRCFDALLPLLTPVSYTHLTLPTNREV